MNYFNESGSYESEVKKTQEKTYGTESMCCMGSMHSSNMQMGYGAMMPNMGPSCMPIYECPEERVCHRYVCYDVPHIMPVNTRIVNHHIYRHTFRPEYTCCEENVCENVYEPRCCY